nr:PREDICTED: armadillo repeat-containing protein 5 [Linepithema humile]
MSLPKIPWEDLTGDCPIVLELARHFRAENKSGIATCLAQLKNDPKLRKEFTKQANNLCILAQLLRCQNHAILNMSLSILADACIAFEAREKVRSSEIGSNVVLIIKNSKLDNRLHCRACRLVSNLSECSWHAKVLYNTGIVEALKELLMSKTSTQTYCMAVRAVRNIWSFYEQSREKMIEHEIMKLVAQIFVMVEKKSSGDAKYVDLIDACLKAMCAFLGTLDPRCGIQMEVEKNKQGYRCLMRCCSMNSNKMAIKCLYGLCQIAECRLLLGISGAVEELVTLINTKHLHEEVLVSLCMFCRESVNRDRIKDCNGLQLILALLKKPEHERYHPVLLQALAQFLYDDIAIDILVKHGIVEILVAKLTSIAASVDSKKSNASRKRYSDYPPESQKTPLKYNRIYSRFSMDYYRDDWSPRSTTSASSSSPPSTPPLRVFSDSNAETDDTEDDIYSPICSDTECGDNDEEVEIASLKSCKSLTVGEADSDAPSSDTKIPSKNVCEYHTLLLLGSFSLRTIDGLADPTTINALMTYITVNVFQKRHRYSAIKILHRIMRNAAYFTSLLKQGLVFEIQTLPESEEWTRCLRTVAETGGSIGHLSFMLLRGEEQHKLLTAVSIPLLIKIRSTLERLLNKYGGLELIFRLLVDSSHDWHERAIWSICQLAKSLKIDPFDVRPIPLTAGAGEPRDYSRLSLEASHPTATVSSTVTFELDDGTTVEACRKMLCCRSDVFSAMLDGNFSESGKKRVRLKNTSRDGLITLILAATGAAFEYQSIESLLDAVLLADKFLMPDLLETLTETAIDKLSHENFCRVWRWARKYSCHELRSCCVKSFLVAKTSWSETVRTFRDFSATDDFGEFLNEIREIIVGELCQV